MNLLARRRSVFTSLAMGALLLGGGALFSRTRAQEARQTSLIAPGISLLSVSTQTPSGPLRYWLIKADKTAARLALEVAAGRDVNRKRSVRELAAQSKALVAVNGGFFAYEGAAVGAVKVAGEWQRLPWKSRTALAWDENRAQIGPLSGTCQLKLDFADGTSKTIEAALNGFALPGTHAALTDGFSVLTARFATKYRLKSGEIAAFAAPGAGFIAGNKEPIPLMQSVSRGEISIPAQGFVVVARGASAAFLQPKATTPTIPPRASFTVATSPIELDSFPNILGAGPLLIENGAVKTTETAEEFRPDVLARGPRTAVGFDAGGNTLFLVADGRQAASIGLTIPETAQLFQQLGATQALNLDGGSSTQLVIGGQLINAPSGYDPVNPFGAREVGVTNALVLRSR